jgi:hypothetical protein
MPQRFRFLAVLLIPLLSLLAGCNAWTQRGAKGLGLLPKAAPGERHFSTYETKNPYVELGQGILYRKLFESAGPDGLTIEVRDLLVGPRRQTSKVTLPGAALCEMRSGSGTLTTDDHTQDLGYGAAFMLPEGSTFAISNKSDNPISIRVHLIRAK